MSSILYKLRTVNGQNLADLEVLNLMAYHPEVMKAKGYWKRNFDFENKVDLHKGEQGFHQAKGQISRKYEDVYLGVADSRNRLVGWVWFYEDKSHPLPQSICQRLELTKRNARIYQISYEKLMSENWPSELLEKIVHTSLRHLVTRRKGVIVEGLRLAIQRIARAYRKLYSVKRKLVIYAFTHPQNLASRRVLEKNGFGREKRKYSYDGVPHYLWVKVV